METQEIRGGGTQEICGGRHKRLGVDLGRQRDTAEMGDRGDMGGTQGRFGGGGINTSVRGCSSSFPCSPSPLALALAGGALGAEEAAGLVDDAGQRLQRLQRRIHCVCHVGAAVGGLLGGTPASGRPPCLPETHHNLPKTHYDPSRPTTTTPQDLSYLKTLQEPP